MLKQDIESQIKEALKSGDQMRLCTLRFLLAAIQNEEIAKQKELTEEDVVAVVQRQVKQHRESIEAFQKAHRDDLVQKEQTELQILNKFLPQQLSEEELRKVVEEVVGQLPESEKNNFGKVMGAVIGRVKGKTDGSMVSEVVKEFLA